MNNTVLEFKDVTQTFGSGNTLKHVLKHINLKVKENTLNLILGPSGSGKSTLIYLASLLLHPTTGEIVLNGLNTSELTLSERSKLRREEIGVIYQRENLLTYLNMLENVTLPMIKTDPVKAGKQLHEMGLENIKEYPAETTMMNQQLVTLTRAIINNPSLLLADEPTGELNTGESIELLKKLKKLGKTIIITSDNPELIKYADKTYNLHDGLLKTNP